MAQIMRLILPLIKTGRVEGTGRLKLERVTDWAYARVCPAHPATPNLKKGGQLAIKHPH